MCVKKLFPCDLGFMHPDKDFPDKTAAAMAMAHSGTFDEFYYHLNWFDCKKNSSNHGSANCNIK